MGCWRKSYEILRIKMQRDSKKKIYWRIGSRVANEDGEGDQRAISEGWRSDGLGIHLGAAGSVSGRGKTVDHVEVEEEMVVF